MRVGLQKMSQARSLHKEIRLQVEQQEVELPSIEGLIFINIPRCPGRGSWGGGEGALPSGLGSCGSSSVGRARPVQPAPSPVHPSLSAQLGLRG